MTCGSRRHVISAWGVDSVMCDVWAARMQGSDLLIFSLLVPEQVLGVVPAPAVDVLSVAWG